MKSLILFVLLGIHSLTYAADAPAASCDRLTLVLDPHLTSSAIEQRWGSGEASSDTPASLELHGCKGELLDHMALDAPLARLDKTPLHGVPVRTYLVSEDLTAPAGSYSGPLTMLVQVENHKLKRAEATTDNGAVEPINLALTGKAAWKKVPAGAADDFLSVSCQPKDDGFVTSFRRYHLTPHGWQIHVRSEPIFWESDGEFPENKRFPR